MPKKISKQFDDLPPTLAAFAREDFERRLALDAAMSQMMIALAVGAVVLSFVASAIGTVPIQGVASVAAPVVLVLLWVLMSTTTAKVTRGLPPLAQIAHHPAQQLETRIAQALEQKPVMRWARLMTYHRLATLRHRQGRFEEAAEICHAILSQPLNGPAAGAKPHLLLMLVEANLGARNLTGAYHALEQLHATRLSLVESLQRLVLATRYELMVGAFGETMQNARSKIEMAELMPVPQCGAMHAMLATAAQRTGEAKKSAWLWERANLLTSPEMLDRLKASGFEIRTVEEPEEEA